MGNEQKKKKYREPPYEPPETQARALSIPIKHPLRVAQVGQSIGG